jgi:ATP-dependent DNA helicase RecQ
MDSKYFHLSDEVYKNRKDDAARRAQAVIDFVNNAGECRSVQLLRYFGEDIKKTCGKCDVCSSKNKMSINDKEYQEISESIIHELRESNSDVYNVLNKINQYHEEKVLKTIRIMVDNNIIIQDSEGNLKL